MLEQALGKSPKNLEGLTLQADLALGEDRTNDAVALLERAVNAHPNHYVSRFKLSQTYARVGRKEDAENEAARATELKEIYEELTRLTKLVWEKPDDVEIRFQLGLTELKVDRKAEAVSWFRSILAMEPDHFEARKKLHELTGEALPVGPRPVAPQRSPSKESAS